MRPTNITFDFPGYESPSPVQQPPTSNRQAPPAYNSSFALPSSLPTPFYGSNSPSALNFNFLQPPPTPITAPKQIEFSDKNDYSELIYGNAGSETSMYRPPSYKDGTQKQDYSDLDQEIIEQEESKLRALLIKGGGVVEDENPADIFYYTIFGDVAGVKRAVEEHGAEVNQFDNFGHTPLHYACRRPIFDTVKYLIEQGASLSAKSNNKFADLPLHVAVEGGDLEVVNYLIEQGADIDAKNGIGLTPLHVAIQKEKKLISVYLIYNHADIHSSDMEGHNALHWAVYKDIERILSLLIKFGGNLKSADNNGMIPLHWAAVRGSTACLQKLLEIDPSAVHTTTNAGKTPLQMAIEYHRHESVTILQNHSSSTSRASSSFFVISWLRDIFSPAARGFLFPAVYIPVLLFLVAYFHYLVSMVSLFVLVVVTSKVFGERGSRERNKVMMGTFLWSYCYTFYIYFARILPITYHIWWFQIFFCVLNTVLYEWYRQLAFGDPGFLEASHDETLVMINEIKAGADKSNYCSTCWIKKPLRSKHCGDCDRCVLKLDHHCPFTGNCVGAKNMKLFYINHTLYVIAELSWFWICYQFGVMMNYGDSTTSYYNMFWLLRDHEPWLWATLIWHSVNFGWMLPLWVQQTYQITHNLTTNEMWNSSRYEYFRDPNTGAFKNPYDKGIIYNLREVFFATPREVYMRTINPPDMTSTHSPPPLVSADAFFESIENKDL